MTTWSVVKDDTREKRRRVSPRRLFPRILPRFAFLACLALVAVSLGAALTPVVPREPPEPPFSERARASALTAALRLRTAGEQLSEAAPDPGSGTGQPAFSQTVTLLTTQARALLGPGDAPPDASAEPPSSTPSAASSSPPLPTSAAGLAAELARSGSQRLADAATADGGMARLLAAVGTGQLLQASALAAGAGPAVPAVPAGPAVPAVPAVPAQADPASASAQPSGACPAPDVTASSVPPAPSTGGTLPGAAALGGALAATVRIEAETVYGYQVALTRLGGDAAKPAAEQLARHEALVSAAETLSRGQCVPVPPLEAGYVLGPSFLAAPAAGLAGQETATLPVYGDLVALSDGETRRWAIAGLLDAARRAVLWGRDPGPLPGLLADPAAFPALPAGALPPESPAAR
ncbi:DUF4439 domain-containing protein [Pseudarthrobacter albicanus]|uniref:DUF4439 domain-containing protein n=1 Tax=Pseudarthrobacter albicanus TaxID=2823873 RepID=UPI001BA7473D|nr:DUF4439 domain-containing protein [Pseudarthrobacter albicanus]